MANTVRLKRSAVQGKAPVVGDLELGELAVNTYDGKLYTKKNDGSDAIVEIGGGAGSTNLSYTQSTNELASSSGTNVTLPLAGASTNQDGLMSHEDKAKLDGIAASAEVNAVDSVNTQTGAVVLDADDIDDTSTTHKFATAAQLSAADSALQPGDIGSTVQGYDADTVKTDVYAAFTKAVKGEEQLGNSAINFQDANNWRITSSVTVPTPTNGAQGMSGVFRITAGTLVWPSVFKFPGGSAPTITSYPAVIPYYVQNSTNILMGNITEGIS